MEAEITVEKSITEYLEEITATRSDKTLQSYKRGLDKFTNSLLRISVDPSQTYVSQTSKSWFENFLSSISTFSLSTQHLYFASVKGWFKFLLRKKLIPSEYWNLLHGLQSYSKNEKIFQNDQITFHELSQIITYALDLNERLKDLDVRDCLIALRDRAIIILLADTGLEVETVASLKRNNVDLRSRLLLIYEKGVPRSIDLSPRANQAITDYLSERSKAVKNTGRSVKHLPLFSRHDKASSNKISPLTPTSYRNIVKQRSVEALGIEIESLVSPISFRKYFATSILNSISLLHPKIIVKCQSHFESGHYDEAIFNAMKVVEEEVRSKASLKQTDFGANLITSAMKSNPPLIRFSSVDAEQDSAYYLFRGAIGSFKNPLSHRFLDTSDPIKTVNILALASLLMQMLDEATS